MRITVDGIDYAPVRDNSVGVAITSHNRPEVLAETLAAFAKYSPNIPIVVVDDGSDVPVVASCTVVRHNTPVGIAQAKNRCLSELMKLGVQHLFLFDDDTRPVCDDWWRPYVDSPEPHLQHSWTHFTNGRQVEKMAVLHQDANLIAYSWSMGCMLYLTADVVKGVGGMRPAFGAAMHEHIEYSKRICNAGLTSFPFQDVPNSHDLFDARDRTQTVKSSIKIPDRRQLLARNDELLAGYSDSSDFQPYGHRDIVLTCLFTGQPDPQRKAHMKSDPRLADTLLSSLDGQDVVVLCDFPTQHDQFVRVETSHSPYIQRWISYRQYLIQHPEVRFVWCVDATDVESLQNPFTLMQAGTLYCGWENQIVGCDWMRHHHSASLPWIDANADRTLLNAGVVGADRDTMLTFINRLLGAWAENQSDAAGDMGYFNRAAYSLKPVTGPRITTVFKTNQPTDWSLWRHK